MRKFTCTLMLMFSAFLIRAQVPNPGFEQVDSTGHIEHWSRNYIFSFWADSNGNFHGDTILLDGLFYTSSMDAHTGHLALLLNSGYNRTKGEGIAGAVDLTSLKTGYGGFNAKVPLTAAPSELRFWYKFMPVGADTGQALLTVYDSTGNNIGSAEILLTAATTAYTEAAAPVSYTGNTAGAAWFSLTFSASRISSSAHYGTRMLIDDVNLTPLGIRQEQPRVLRSYPTVVTDRVHIDVPALQHADWQLYNNSGQQIRSGALQGGGPFSLGVRDLPAGHYVVWMRSGESRYVARFVRP